MSIQRSVARAGIWSIVLALVWLRGAGAADRAEPAGVPPAPAPAAAPAMPPGMMCPMMAAMMGGMGMAGMSMAGQGGMSMNHGSGTGTTLTDMAQNVSMRDIVQLVLDLAAIQERMLAAMPRGQTGGLRRDVVRLQERSRELLTEIRGLVSAAARGE